MQEQFLRFFSIVIVVFWAFIHIHSFLLLLTTFTPYFDESIDYINAPVSVSESQYKNVRYKQASIYER